MTDMDAAALAAENEELRELLAEVEKKASEYHRQWGDCANALRALQSVVKSECSAIRTAADQVKEDHNLTAKAMIHIAEKLE